MKDTCWKTYAVFTPVYKTTQEVRNAIGSAAPQPIQEPGKFFVKDNYIFLNEVDKGIHIIDNSNPAAPVNKYFIAIPGNQDLAVSGNYLYADLYADMVTIDISDPTKVSVKQYQPGVFPFRMWSSGFVASDTSKIITEWLRSDTTVKEECGATGFFGKDRKDVVIFDIMSASLRSFSAGASRPPSSGQSGSMARFALVAPYLYTVTTNALNTFDITNPALPVFKGNQQIGWGIETIYPFKQNLFIGSNTGMFIYGLSNPVVPVRTGMFSHAMACDPVVADDDFAYVTLRSGTACVNAANQLDILDVRNLAAPVLIKTYPMSNPHGLAVQGNDLFICDGKAGLKWYDVRDKRNIQLVDIATGMETYDVIVSGDLVMLVAKDGFYQYRLNASNRFSLLSKIGYPSK
jgi:hypothetical protein